MKTADQFDEELHMQSSATPESIAIAGDDRERLTRALETLPPRFREVLVLRELEGCSYKEIAAITSIPMGTVMSHSPGPAVNCSPRWQRVPEGSLRMSCDTC
jgi:RNA polymerase sigma factor (sigma-70 family)